MGQVLEKENTGEENTEEEKKRKEKKTGKTGKNEQGVKRGAALARGKKVLDVQSVWYGLKSTMRLGGRMRNMEYHVNVVGLLKTGIAMIRERTQKIATDSPSGNRML